MGDIANPGAALGQGLTTGSDFAKSAIGASREREQHALSIQQNQGQQESAAANTGQPVATDLTGSANANAQAHTGFLASLGQGLASIGTGIANHFSGANPGAAPASALPAPGAAAGNAGALPTGAPVTAPAAVGAIPGAPTANVAPGVPGLEAGGPMPNTGAALGAGLTTGADFGKDVVGASREREQHAKDIQDRQAAADSAVANTGGGALPPAAAAADPNSPDQPAAIAAAVVPDGTAAQQHPVEDFAAHLHSGALNDAGVPNDKAGIAAPTPQAQLQNAAQNPAAQQGIPETPKGAAPGGTSSTPHSLTPDFWDTSDAKMSRAAQAAALAGHDPDAVYSSLSHMRTAFVQGHMLRNLSAASVALQNGDTKGVEQGLRNMNYYLPNGKDLTVQKDAQGGLVYQDPISPYLDKDGNPTSQKSPDAKPNMIPVDQQHLQMLGQATLDPMKVNDTIINARSAAAKQGLERMQAQAVLTTANSKMSVADTRSFLSKSQSIRNLSAAQFDQAKAQAGGFAMRRIAAANPKMDPTVLRGAKEASDAVDQAALGRKVAVPTTDNEGNPSLSPAAGHNVNDASTVPASLKGASVLELGDIKAMAADLYAANAKDGMTSFRAAQIAIQAHSSKGTSHRGPDGKQQPDYYIHRENGEAGVWNPRTKTYERVKMPASSISAELDGKGKMQQDDLTKGLLGFAGSGSSGGNDGTDPEDSNPDDSAPAIEPPSK